MRLWCLFALLSMFFACLSNGWENHLYGLSFFGVLFGIEDEADIIILSLRVFTWSSRESDGVGGMSLSRVDVKRSQLALVITHLGENEVVVCWGFEKVVRIA